MNASHRDRSTGWSSYIRPMLPFLGGFVVGWCIWHSWLTLTGKEPWDIAGNYYWLCLFAGAFMAALLNIRSCYLAPVGVYLGQIAYMEIVYRASLRPGDAVIIPSFIGVAIFGLLPAIAGAVAAFVIAHMLRPGNLFRKK